MTTVAAFVLTGGKSSRMGQEKSALLLNGNTLLERAIEIAHVASDDVRLLGTPDRVPQEVGAPYLPAVGRCGITVIPDRFPGCGPLAGIDAALAATNAELNFILSVDTPFVPEGFVRYLVERARGHDALVTYPHLNSGYQPLCAVYRKEFGPIAEAALQSGHYKIDPLFARIPTCTIDDAELRKLGFSDEIFDNLNTPDDWERAQQRSHTA
jgi:molybdopterin-guanine dinucleotide biosynthesis protein A